LSAILFPHAVFAGDLPGVEFASKAISGFVVLDLQGFLVTVIEVFVWVDARHSMFPFVVK
jgi:hypothetical protein